jgi:hypothetical protein
VPVSVTNWPQLFSLSGWGQSPQAEMIFNKQSPSQCRRRYFDSPTAVSGTLYGMPTNRRFPPPWSVEDIGAVSVVKDSSGRAVNAASPAAANAAIAALLPVARELKKKKPGSQGFPASVPVGRKTPRHQSESKPEYRWPKPIGSQSSSQSRVAV